VLGVFQDELSLQAVVDDSRDFGFYTSEIAIAVERRSVGCEFDPPYGGSADLEDEPKAPRSTYLDVTRGARRKPPL